MGTIINDLTGGNTGIAGVNTGGSHSTAASADEPSAIRQLIEALNGSEGVTSAQAVSALAVIDGSSTAIGDELAQAATNAGFTAAADDTLEELHTVLTA